MEAREGRVLSPSRAAGRPGLPRPFLRTACPGGSTQRGAGGCRGKVHPRRGEGRPAPWREGPGEAWGRWDEAEEGACGARGEAGVTYLVPAALAAASSGLGAWGARRGGGRPGWPCAARAVQRESDPGPERSQVTRAPPVRLFLPLPSAPGRGSRAGCLVAVSSPLQRLLRF